MKKTILERYPLTPEGYYVIDIHAGKTSDLYNNFDKVAPYVKKELDQELVDYITNSAAELDDAEYLIQFRLQEPADDDLKERIVTSINSYFMYIRSIEIEELGRMMRKSLILLIVGIALLSLSIWANSVTTEDASVMEKVFAEGLTVAAWVSMWEAIANFLINWTPISRKLRLYKKIAEAKVLFA